MQAGVQIEFPFFLQAELADDPSAPVQLRPFGLFVNQKFIQIAKLQQSLHLKAFNAEAAPRALVLFPGQGT